MAHYEGELEVVGIFNNSDSEDSDDCIPIAAYKNLLVKKGPTIRSHGRKPTI